ncbi:uncharacterized protein LOC132857255 [Tachysurus vachellii]|uniref:uncharacterized protein LOC132857255 n=1 Tax=Tachysurus vachellii TaxID=175792 RepID=UPI00296B3697|nr:uncharacterized protein LOC132857255 [Tachysurus vachellii]
MSLLYISILWVCACVDSAESLVTVSAPVGSTVILPCNLTEEFKPTSVITWKINNKLVFVRSSDGTYQGKGYEGRVDVPEDELLKGNCSLVMKNIRFSDKRIYSSSMIKDIQESVLVQKVKLSVVEVSVNERGSSSKGSDSHQTGGNKWIISCVVIVIFIIIIIIICVSVYCCCVKGFSCVTTSTEQMICSDLIMDFILNFITAPLS